MKELYKEFNISEDIVNLVNDCEKELKDIFYDIDEKCEINTLKILKAFHENKLSESHLMGTNGYGYGDIGREAIDNIFASVLGGESSIVRNQFVSGTHALTVCFNALLRPGDILLSISGTPYDTLHEVIGIKDNDSSLKSYGIKYDEISLIDNEFDEERIINYLKEENVKVIEIQRSKGYSTRKSISVNKIKNIIETIRKIKPGVIIMVDNCYCEFVEVTTPLEVGADIMVGSLIKNLGAGIASNGAYIAGRNDLIELCAERLLVPGEGKEVGPTLGANELFLKGLFFSPEVVANSLKIATLTSLVMEKLGYNVEPRYNESRVDIVENIIFGNELDLINYVKGIQSGSPVDAHALPEAWDMPGYSDKIIMASGSFTQGSSIELSCDAPIREPYIAYQQGGLTYHSGKIGLMKALMYLNK